MSPESCASGNIMILACSGASNLGQLSNQAAVELTREGFGKMSCLAGVGAHLGGFVQAAKKTQHLVAIDGCSVACVKNLLEHADVPQHTYVMLSDLGIEKTSNTVLIVEEVEKVKTAVKDACKERLMTLGGHSDSSSGCCG